MKQFIVRTTKRSEFIDITSDVQHVVNESKRTDGLAVIFVPHTTAAVTINENADPDVVDDILSVLDELVPRSSAYKHREGNSDSHVKSSLLGPSLTVIIKDGRLCLGTWQGIYFCEFDGPRSRTCFVDVK